jgi:hypothetical protein
MTITSDFPIEFSQEIEGGDSLTICEPSIRSIWIRFWDEMAEVIPLSWNASWKISVSKLLTKKRDSDVTCCFTQA